MRILLGKVKDYEASHIIPPHEAVQICIPLEGAADMFDSTAFWMLEGEQLTIVRWLASHGYHSFEFVYDYQKLPIMLLEGMPGHDAYPDPDDQSAMPYQCTLHNHERGNFYNTDFSEKPAPRPEETPKP